MHRKTSSFKTKESTALMRPAKVAAQHFNGNITNLCVQLQIKIDR